MEQNGTTENQRKGILYFCGLDLSSEWWAGDEVEGDSEAVGEGVSNVVLGEKVKHDY